MMHLPHCLVKISKQRTKRNKGFSASMFPCREGSVGMNYIYFQNYNSEEDPLQIKCTYFEVVLAQVHNPFGILPIDWYN